MDMPPIMGGGGLGPTPGFYARAGVAGCVSIGIKQTAVMAGVDFRRVTVDVETDFDDGAALGIGDRSAAPLETRLTIRIETGEAESDVRALVTRALEMDPWFLALRDAQSVAARIEVGG
ncbi:MAG: OsmC family protein [Longimicrobiales bacterium]|nr:OsmC family protein [Longimicrobiales bacterium]